MSLTLSDHQVCPSCWRVVRHLRGEWMEDEVSLPRRRWVACCMCGDGTNYWAGVTSINWEHLGCEGHYS